MRQRRLSLVGRVGLNKEDGEMASAESYGEDELRPTASTAEKFKFHKKFFDQCNTVDHASVPRKLRSAIRKRNHDSISPALPDSKKLNHTVNGAGLPKKGWKKSKVKLQKEDYEGSPKNAIVGPITKDEEEVVETLYALSGMFPDIDRTNVAKLSGKLSEAKCLALPPEAESPMPAFEVPEEKSPKIICATGTMDDRSFNSEEPNGKNMELQSSSEASQLDLTNSKQFPVVLNDSVPQINLPTPFSRSEHTTQLMSCNSVILDCPFELSQVIGLPKREESPASVRKTEIALGPDATIGSQVEISSTVKESKNKGSAMWPGSCSVRSLPKPQAPSSQSSNVKLPIWLANANCTRSPCSSKNVLIAEKDSECPADRRKSWKRCSAHVNICRLIQLLQISERKDMLPFQRSELIPSRGSCHEALMAAKKLNDGQNSLSGVASINSVASSAVEKNPNEVRNTVLMHHMLLRDQQQTSTTPWLHAPQQHGFDFLSLTTGDWGLEANNSFNRRNGMEASTQFHVSHLHSLMQNHKIMPFSPPQNYYSSSPFTDHFSVAAEKQVQTQLHPYPGSTFCGPRQLGTLAPPKQQQQQQRIWASQLASQQKPAGLVTTHIPNYKNESRDSPSLIQYAQAILPPSSSSLDVVGPKYAPILTQLHQHQQLIAFASSLPPARVKREPHQLPSGHEAAVGGFYPDYTPPVQLLCNEHL